MPPSAVTLRSGAVGTATIKTPIPVAYNAVRKSDQCSVSVQDLPCIDNCRQAQQQMLTNEADVGHLQLWPEVGEPGARILCP
jgi:hypothetical protein